MLKKNGSSESLQPTSCLAYIESDSKTRPKLWPFFRPMTSLRFWMMQYGGGLGLTGVGGEMETSSQGRHLSHPPLNDKLSHRHLLKGSLLNQHWLIFCESRLSLYTTYHSHGSIGEVPVTVTITLWPVTALRMWSPACCPCWSDRRWSFTREPQFKGTAKHSSVDKVQVFNRGRDRNRERGLLMWCRPPGESPSTDPSNDTWSQQIGSALSPSSAIGNR